MYSRIVKRLVAIIIVVVMVVSDVNLGFVSWLTKGVGNSVVAEAKTYNKKDTEPTVVKEVEELRTANSSTYLLSNGSKRLEVYGTNIRYEKDGEYIDYDPFLKKMSEEDKTKLKKDIKSNIMLENDDFEEYMYVNVSGDAKQFFPKQLDSDTGVLMEKDNYAISFTPVKENDIKIYESETENIDESVVISETAQDIENISLEILKDSVEGNEITYLDEKNEIEYRYTSNTYGVKEEIVLKEKPTTNILTFEFNLSGMKLQTREDSKSINIIDAKTDEIVAYIEEPNIKNKNGVITYDEVSYKIEEQKEGTYDVQIIIDKNYLESETTEYPVIIDPTVCWMSTYLGSVTLTDMPYTTSVNMQNTSTMQVQNKCNTFGPYKNTHMYSCIDTSGLTTGKSFVGNAFNLEYAYIENAYLQLYEYKNNGFTYTTDQGQTHQFIEFTPGTVEVRSIEDEWSLDTVTWDKNIHFGENIWAEFACTGTEGEKHIIDLTEWARKVVRKEVPNNGLVLCAKEEGTGDTFYSGQMCYVKDETTGSSMPRYAMIAIEYRDIGRYYGVSGVYAPTGNYSESSTDISVQTVLGNISLGRIYNSIQDCIDSSVDKGFSFNYAMRILPDKDGVKVVMPDSSHWSFRDYFEDYQALDNRGTLTHEVNEETVEEETSEEIVKDEYKLVTLDKMEYRFNADGYLKYIKDEYGNQLNFATDENGNVTAITDKSGTDVRFTYSEGILTKIEEIKDSTVNQVVEYTYIDNYLKKVKAAGGMETIYDYTDGKVSKVTYTGTKGTSDETNSETITATEISYYTEGAYAGLVKTIADSTGVKSVYNYDFENSVTTVDGYEAGQDITTSEKIRSIKYTYNDSLAVTKIEDLKADASSQQVQQIEYDTNSAGEMDPDTPSSSVDEYGNTTYYEYDDNGNLTKTTYPDGSTEMSEYDQDTNKQLKYTDRNGLVTEYTYENEFLVKTVCGGIQTSAYTYHTESDSSIYGLVKTETDIHGNVTSYEYDGKGNVLKVTQTIDGVSHITTNEYDSQGRLVKTIDPNGIVTESYYNAMGNALLIKVSDSAGEAQFTRTVYDALGRAIRVIDPIDYKSSVDNLDADNYGDISVGTWTYYNDKGQIVKETDELGNTTKYEYDADGNMVKEIQPNGSYKKYVYDKDGRITEESFCEVTTDEEGNETKTTTLLKSISYAWNKNETTTVEYLASGLINTTIEECNWEGNVVKTTYDNGFVEESNYEKGLLTKEYDNQGGWTEYTYDKWGRVLTETSAFDETGNSQTKYTYDNYGNVICEEVKDNASGYDETYSKTVYGYDSRDNLVKTVTYEGSTPINCSQRYYSWDGKLLREYKGFANPIIINGLDNISDRYNQEYSVIKYEYDTMGRLSKKTDALGNVEEYKYDKANRTIYTKDRNGIEHTKEYDKADNVTKEISGNITKEYFYDCIGNVTSETEINTTSGTEKKLTTTYTYDGKGNCKTETTGNVVKEFSYNYADMLTLHVIKVDGVQKQKVRNEYDEMGNLTKVYESGTLKASYTYDLSGRLIKTENANGTSETNTYNLAGYVTSTINKLGTDVLSQYVYTYYYDGQEKSKTSSIGISTYTYDGAGQLVKEVRKLAASDNTSFEKADNITIDSPTVVDMSTYGQTRYYSFTPAASSGYTITSSNASGDPKIEVFDAEGNSLWTDDNSGDGYNFKIYTGFQSGMEYVIAVSDNSGKGVCTLEITQVLSDGNTSESNCKMIVENTSMKVDLNEQYQMRYYSFIPSVTGIYTIESSNNSGDPRGGLYAEDGTLLLYDHNSSDGINFKLEYELTAGVPYVIKVALIAGTGHCTMRITSPESAVKNSVEYTYDANGNRVELKEVENGEITNITYTYDKNDRLITEQKGTQDVVTYSYDKNGNLTGKSDGIVQVFDELNRMTSYKSTDGTTTIYSYYPDNMRMSKKVGTEEITQVWVDSDIALDLSNSESVSYVYGQKLITSEYGWYLYNAHGDVTTLTDSEGNVVRDYDYDSFGVQRTDVDEEDKNPYRYCGEYYDCESGYTYLEARYYAAGIGRFISEDPAFDGNNWYIYCGNDPVNMIDPTGMWSKSVHEEMTKNALKKVNKLKKNKNLKLAKLMEGCVYQDKHRKEISRYGTSYGNKEWHGKGTYKALAKELKRYAVKKWKQGKYKKACLYLGMGVHTLQDHQAHTVVLDGKRQNSAKIIDGTLEKTDDIWVVPDCMQEYMGKNFIKKCAKNGVNGKSLDSYVGRSMHVITADNVNADFINNKWVYTKGKSSRYKKAVKKTKEYLKDFYKKIKKKK